MLNESQNRTKRAPFTDELMSKHPRKRETTPSPTHTGQPFRAGFHRGTKVSSSEKLKESFILQEKQGRQEKPPGTGSAPEAGTTPQHRHPVFVWWTEGQLSPEAQPTSPLEQQWEASSKGWSSRVCVVGIGFCLHQPQPCVWGNYFLSLRFPTWKGGMLLPLLWRWWVSR